MSYFSDKADRKHFLGQLKAAWEHVAMPTRPNGSPSTNGCATDAMH
jgi:hypothetical protein